jgi:uncharacterized protein
MDVTRGPLMEQKPDFSETRLRDPALIAKYLLLTARLRELGKVLIGFSGGVDSTLLTGAARFVLGRDAVTACLAVGPSLAAAEHADAVRLAALMDVELREYAATEFENPAYVANGPDRCYHCKTDLFVHLRRFSEAAGQAAEKAALLYGGNTDDTLDYRPGRRAALDHGALAPLAEAGLSKADVRALSRAFGLPTADKPAQPCLSSRIPYGASVDAGKLAMVEAGEAALAKMGFRESRLRHFGDTARIEVPVDQLHLFGDAEAVRILSETLRGLGFPKMDIDPAGFRSGSLNGALSEEMKRRHTGSL